jgi:hypothetical protein
VRVGDVGVLSSVSDCLLPNVVEHLLPSSSREWRCSRASSGGHRVLSGVAQQLQVPSIRLDKLWMSSATKFAGRNSNGRRAVDDISLRMSAMPTLGQVIKEKVTRTSNSGDKHLSGQLQRQQSEK